jgi:hypothetical protein
VNRIVPGIEQALIISHYYNYLQMVQSNLNES